MTGQIQRGLRALSTVAFALLFFPLVNFSAQAAPVATTQAKPVQKVQDPALSPQTVNAVNPAEEAQDTDDDLRPELDSLLRDYELDEALWGDLDRDLDTALDARNDPQNEAQNETPSKKDKAVQSR
jgi:hypothetical protein